MQNGNMDLEVERESTESDGASRIESTTAEQEALDKGLQVPSYIILSFMYLNSFTCAYTLRNNYSVLRESIFKQDLKFWQFFLIIFRVHKKCGHICGGSM